MDKETLREIEKTLEEVPVEDLVRLLLKRFKKEDQEGIPITVFAAGLSPLESITRYLKETGYKINGIAKILHKSPSSISQAFKKAKEKNFDVKETKVYIPLSAFYDQPVLSILEAVVKHLYDKHLSYSEIAKLLNRNPKTIWTVYNRAKKKIT